MLPELPLRNDGETMVCALCGAAFQPVGRQRFCTPAHRQAAWRRRHPTPLPTVPARTPRQATVYQCPECESRYLGDQYCSDCGRFCRRIGVGGLCPACEEPVAIIDLLPEHIQPIPPASRTRSSTTGGSTQHHSN
jgi:hypothetical protein